MLPYAGNCDVVIGNDILRNDGDNFTSSFDRRRGLPESVRSKIKIGCFDLTRNNLDAPKKKVRSFEKLSDSEKPDHSYLALISMAILSTKDGRMLLGDIYQFIMDKFPFYKKKQKAWRNSIRHNLSINECFIKAGRSDSGKGSYWAIHPACVGDFQKGDFRRRQARSRARKGTKSAEDEELHIMDKFHPYEEKDPTQVRHYASTLFSSEYQSVTNFPGYQPMTLTPVNQTTSRIPGRDQYFNSTNGMFNSPSGQQVNRIPPANRKYHPYKRPDPSQNSDQQRDTLIAQLICHIPELARSCLEWNPERYPLSSLIGIGIEHFTSTLTDTAA